MVKVFSDRFTSTYQAFYQNKSVFQPSRSSNNHYNPTPEHIRHRDSCNDIVAANCSSGPEDLAIDKEDIVLT